MGTHKIGFYQEISNIFLSRVMGYHGNVLQYKQILFISICWTLFH